MKRALRVALFLGLLLVLLAASRVVPALADRWRAPSGEAAPARVIDLCAERRPDATLPAACADAAPEVTLLFGGDTALADAALPTLRDRGIDFPFQHTLALLAAADVSVVNLEAPVTAIDRPFRFGKEYLYRAPPEAAEAMARAGIDVASLANNHVLDHGAEGLSDTLARLAAVGVFTVGAAASEASARAPLVIRIGGLRVALLARCQRKLDWDLWVRQFAAPDRAGVAALDPAPGQSLAADVAAARREADLVILLVHWGQSYAPVDAEQRRLAELGAAAGVDLIIGHHPHVAQPLGLLGRARVPVAFSLGNYAFGTPGRPELDVGLLLRATVRSRRLSRLELIPIDVQNRRVGYRPTPLTGTAALEALAPLLATSRREGAALRIEGARAVQDHASEPDDSGGSR